MTFDPISKIIGKTKIITTDRFTKNLKKPEYGKCNAGHPLVEVYNEKYDRYDWDCPTCIQKMKKAREVK